MKLLTEISHPHLEEIIDIIVNDDEHILYIDYNKIYSINANEKNFYNVYYIKELPKNNEYGYDKNYLAKKHIYYSTCSLLVIFISYYYHVEKSEDLYYGLHQTFELIKKTVNKCKRTSYTISNELNMRHKDAIWNMNKKV